MKDKSRVYTFPIDFSILQKFRFMFPNNQYFIKRPFTPGFI